LANTRAFAAIGEAVIALMREARPAEFQLDEQEFQLLHGRQIQSRDPETKGFSLCMYRVVPSNPRNLPPRRDGERTFRPSLPLDLHWVLTPWHSSAPMQLRMLGWAARFIEDLQTLPAAFLNRAIAGTFLEQEAVELVLDPLGLSDYLALWDRLKAGLPPSLTYVARVVMVDSTIEQRVPGMVQTRAFAMGVPEEP